MRKFLIIMRGVILLALVVLAFKPSVVRPKKYASLSTAVIIDVSRSMQVKDPFSRIEAAKKVIPPLLRKDPHLALFSCAQDVTPLDKEKVSFLSADGHRSDFVGALKKIFQDKKFQLGVLISDGQQVGPGDASGEAASLGVPLIAVGVGGGSDFKDCAVRSVQTPPFAFKNIQTSISANISIVGFNGKRVTIKLKEGDKVLGLQTIDVVAPEVETTIAFSFVPTHVGGKSMAVFVDEMKGEATHKNNRKNFSIDVGRDRFRVLYICGHPGWEYGFLRHQFKSDPAVELVTFVILRNSGNVLNVPDAELSLIPFPSQEDLVRQMPTFDLIVFEEFLFTQYGLMPNLFQAVRKKVEEGGSLLLLGGESVLTAESPYALQYIQEMIPLVCVDEKIEFAQGLFQIEPKIWTHPIVKLNANLEENRKIWGALPPVEGVTLVPQAKAGANVIAAVRHNGKEYPVLASINVGAGRSAMLLTRTTWRWAMLDGRNERTQYAYQQFWKNMVLWLTGAEQYKNVRVSMDNRTIRQGEENSARIWAYDEYFQPVTDVDMKVQLTKPDGSQTQVWANREVSGAFFVPLQGEVLGSHTLQVWAFRRGARWGADSIGFKVVEGYLEEEDLRPNHALLAEIAHASGGRFIMADDFHPELVDEFSKELETQAGEKVLIWASPWLLAGILFLFIADWVWRKRKGFL